MQIKKNVLVVGGSKGIGRAVACRCAVDGFHVVVNCRHDSSDAQATLEQITSYGGTSQLCCFDITDRLQTASALEKLLGTMAIDALVLCAGICNDALLVFMDEAEWDSVLDTNLVSFYAVVKPVVKKMLLSHQGRIVVVSSTSGQAGLAGQVHYAASKAGLIGAVKALALECAKRNVLINAVAPGFIDSAMTEGLDKKELSLKIPLQRFGKTSEVASAVSFLLSADSSYITGQVISVNGGVYM